MGLRAPGVIPMSPAQSNTFTTPTPAKAVYASRVDAYQHALATAGHTYGFTGGMLRPSGNDFIVLLPVPPSVVFMRVTIVLQGNGKLTIDTTGIATNPVVFDINNYHGDFFDLPGFAGVWQSGGQPADVPGGPLKVSSSASWAWGSVSVSVTFADCHHGGEGVLHAITFDPIWEPTAV